MNKMEIGTYFFVCNESGKREEPKNNSGPQFVSPYRFVVLLATILITSCQQQKAKNENNKTPCIRIASLPLKYAKGFSVDYYDGFKIVTVKDLKDSSITVEQYVLHRKSNSKPIGFEEAISIDTPVHKVVCISTTHIAELAVLNLFDSIVGVTNTSLIYNPEIGKRLMNHQVVDLGNSEVNYEKLVELHPSFVFISGGFDGGDKLKLKLGALHIKSVLNLEYTEQDPLARAEWIKFMAVFFDREYEADSIFKETEKRYLVLKELARSVKTKPTVLYNLPFKEIWYMPAGDNYAARLIDDAGGDFLWRDAKPANTLVLNLNYETVYNKASNADIWLNTNFAASLSEIKAADKKNAFFKAYKTGKIYNNNVQIP